MNAIGYAILVFTFSLVTGFYLGVKFLDLEKIQISRTEIKKWINNISPIIFFVSTLLALATLLIMWR